METVLRHNKHRYWTSECRVATGRSAIWHMIRVEKPDHVLMPCYVPQGVIDPFNHGKVPISFYKLKNKLLPDRDDVARLLQLHPGAMVVVINYFGRHASAYEIAPLVREHDGVLFEDCAHALFGPVSYADCADYALWSLNKFLPVVDGAILKSRRKSVTLSPYMHLSWRAYTSYQKHLEINTQIADASDIEEVQQLVRRSSACYEEYYSYIHDDFEPRAQSELSKLIEADYMIGLREQRFERPKSFAHPLMAKSGCRQAACEALISRGVLPSILADKWDHIPKEQGFDVESSFLDNHILVPAALPWTILCDTGVSIYAS